MTMLAENRWEYLNTTLSAELEALSQRLAHRLDRWITAGPAFEGRSPLEE
jgi:hypothetical protein